MIEDKMTPSELRRYRLAWNLGRLDFICGTGKARNAASAKHYRAICNEIVIAVRQKV